MDLILLRTFLTVAQEGSLTLAAKRLHLTQPAVSLQVKSLQRLTGLTLFSRASRGLVLTSNGAALLPYAERAIAAAAEVTRVATMLQGEMSGCLRIGTILDPEFLRVGALLKQLVNTWPRIETRLRHGMSGWVLDEVRSTELDVGFYLGDAGDFSNNPDVKAVQLTTLSYSVIAPPGWNERIKEVKGWAGLASLPWIWTPIASAHQRFLSRELDKIKVRPNIAAEADQEQSMLDLVKSGVGLTLVRDSVALLAASAHGLTIVDGFSVPAVLFFVCRSDRERDPLIAAVVDLVREQWAL
jgi:DNA-binding transcriptional LysR family regulator